MHGLTFATGSVADVGIESVKNRFKLSFDIAQYKALLVDQIAATWAIPLQMIELADVAFSLNHQSNRIGHSLR